MALKILAGIFILMLIIVTLLIIFLILYGSATLIWFFFGDQIEFYLKHRNRNKHRKSLGLPPIKYKA